MSTAKRLHYSYEDYLRTLELSTVKLEFCDGVIYAMAGGSPAHAALAAAVIGVLRQELRAVCSVYTSDLKIRIDASDLSTFPDVAVVCGPLQRATIDENAVTNPTLLVEVTSKGTEDYDRGDKLSHYKQLSSLRTVVFVSHRSRSITVVARAVEGWTEREHRAGERVTIAEPSLDFAVDDIYEGIVLEPTAT